MKDTSQVLVIIVAVSGLLHQTKANTCSAEGSPFTYYQTSGSVESPGYPDYYNANEKCVWYLNPPKETNAGLIVIDLEMEINVGDPSNGVGCRNSKAFALFGSVKGCDKEGPICLAFLLASNRDFKCHNIIEKYFSHCHSLLSNAWPLTVSFHTDKAQKMKGIGLNYTFIDCTEDYTPSTITAKSEESLNNETTEPSVQTSPINTSKGPAAESEESLYNETTTEPSVQTSPINTSKGVVEQKARPHADKLSWRWLRKTIN